MTDQPSYQTEAASPSQFPTASEPTAPPPCTDSTVLEIQTSPLSHDSTIMLAGALTAMTCDRLLETIELGLEHGPQRIVLDLRGVQSIDDSGARALLISHLRASDQGTQLRLAPGSAAVQHAIDSLHGPFVYTDDEPASGAETIPAGQSRVGDSG
jgi:anti-anti-sigma regulatory factor